MIDPAATAFWFGNLQIFSAGNQKRAWHDQLIDKIGPLQSPV